MFLWKYTDGELFTLLGPSGCGKTTILRLIGGFHKPDEGEIYFDGKACDLYPTLRTKYRDGLPELCPLAPHDHFRQHCLWSQTEEDFRKPRC